MVKVNSLGEFLRARRELLSPAAVGLPTTGVRRVPGLRREEVALLAGISADYYLRLEQGRGRHPSVQIVDALARALRLDRASTDHLLQLSIFESSRQADQRTEEAAPAGTRQLLDVLALPAFIVGRYFDVLAANPSANALSPNLQPGRNRLRALFFDPAERSLHMEWERETAQLTASLRESVGADVGDPRSIRLIDELSSASPRFRQLWARHDVVPPEGMPTSFRHPRVGELTLRRETLGIGGTDGQRLVIYHAEPGTANVAQIAALAAASDRSTTAAGPLPLGNGRDAPGQAAWS